MRIKPEIDKSITYRQAGWTIQAITNELGISPSTLYRTFTKHSVKRGSVTIETIESAKQLMLERSGLANNLKDLIASQIQSDLALSDQLKTAVSIALDDLLNDSITPPSIKCKSYAAIATTLKVVSDIQRRCLRIQDETLTVSEVPILTIVKMSPEDIAEVQNRLNKDDLEDEDYIEDDEVMTAE